jgi:hypothetical protein
MFGWRGEAKALLLLNATQEPYEYQLPPLDGGTPWQIVADTSRDEPSGGGPAGETFPLQPVSVALLVNTPAEPVS